MSSSPPGLNLESFQELNKLLHEPARMLLCATLYVVESADFVFLQKHTDLTAGNIASHMAKLESAAYVKVTKSFVGKRPRTVFALTRAGRKALRKYRENLEQILNQLPG